MRIFDQFDIPGTVNPLRIFSRAQMIVHLEQEIPEDAEIIGFKITFLEESAKKPENIESDL